METVSHHGRTTAYRRTRTGERAPVLYVHGSGATHRVWAGQYGDRSGPRPSVALDLSGHGDSDDVDAPPGPETLAAYAADVVAVAEATGARVLCGNSLGGAVVLRVALERDLDLEGLVLCDTGAKLAVMDELLEALRTDFEAAIESLHGPDLLFHDADPEVRERSIEELRETGAEVTHRDFATCDRFDVRDRLGEIDAPALAICGEHDGLTPPKYHRYFAEEMPDCRFVSVPDAAHLPFVERPEAFNERVYAFLRGL